MWKYTVIDKNGEIFTDYYESDINYKASEVCKILESRDFEVLELRKVNRAAFYEQLDKNIAFIKQEIKKRQQRQSKVAVYE